MKKDVTYYEDILNKSEMIISELEKNLEQLEQNLKKYNKLKEYYESEEYLKDVEISNHTEEYSDIACGVLSQDAVYHLMTMTYDSAIRMLELSTKILKE